MLETCMDGFLGVLCAFMKLSSRKFASFAEIDFPGLIVIVRSGAMGVHACVHVFVRACMRTHAHGVIEQCVAIEMKKEKITRFHFSFRHLNL